MLKSNSKFQRIIADIKSKNINVRQKKIPFKGGSLVILFVMQLTDTTMLSEAVIKPLIRHCAQRGEPVDTQTALDKILYIPDCDIDNESAAVLEYVLSGMTVILFSTDAKYLVLNLKRVEKRSIPAPEIQYAARGPKDCFIENLDANISLLQNRIKDDNLQIKNFKVGRRTRSQVAVVYLNDVANENVVKEITRRIEAIDVDGIYESGELQAFLLNKRYNLFPQMGLAERSDMAARLILDGRVVILVEGSCLAITAPITFNEFFYSCDDFYDNKYFGLLSRVIRYIAIFLAFTFSSLYIAVNSFHPYVLPAEYSILLAELSAQVPFAPIVGVLLLEFLMELIRESLIRVPKEIGSAIGIVSAIVIGQAAVSAGLFNPILLMMTSVALLSSFVLPDYTLMNVFRLLKFGIIIITGLFGFFGFTLFLTLVLVNIVSASSFNIPYFAPYAPFNLYDFLRTFMDSRSISPYRTLHNLPQDKTRLKESPNN